MTTHIVHKALKSDLVKLCTQALLFEEGAYRWTHQGKIQSDGQVPQAHSMYGSSITEALLVNLQSVVEDNVKCALIPTYSYARVYRNGDSMKKHRDRPACEVSMSLRLGSLDVKNNSFPLFINKNPVFLEEGDGVIYEGLKELHYRKKFVTSPAGFQVQAFVHYVRKGGRFERFAFDERLGLGLPSESRRTTPVSVGFLRN